MRARTRVGDADEFKVFGSPGAQLNWLNCGISKMANAVESFVTAQNISLFKTLLKKETDPDKRAILLHLLESEFVKLPEVVKRVEMARTISFR
jgi:hypothetical protein